MQEVRQIDNVHERTLEEKPQNAKNRKKSFHRIKGILFTNQKPNLEELRQLCVEHEKTLEKNHHKQFCEKDISKKEQTSDWGNPNLSEKQIQYAQKDTEFLFEIKDKLTQILVREKRIGLFEKCMKVIPILVDMEIEGYKLSTY